MAAHQFGLALGITGPGRLRLGLGHGLGQIQQGGGWAALALADGQKVVAQARRIGDGDAIEQLPAGPLRLAGKTGQHGIDPIGTGAAHQPENAHGGGGRPVKSPPMMGGQLG